MLAVVLGASGIDNIGQAIARRFASEGAAVVVAGRTVEPLKALAGDIGGRAFECDITSSEMVDRLFEHAGGPVKIAVNTVGRNLFRPFMETTADDIGEMCGVHVAGTLLFTQSAVRAMQTGGSIIHISSLTARLVLPDHVAYMATKAAAEVVVKAAAHEFGARGIRVNAIAPALTLTPMTSGLFADAAFVARSGRQAPLRRLTTVQDVAAAAAWLACDECFVTGEILQVNGGMAIHSLPG